MQSLTSPQGHGKIPSVNGSGVATVKVAISYATAASAVLYTVPAGHNLRLTRVYYNNTTAWAGGTSSAIGMSSSNAAYNTAGDLQGGSGGDLTAAMGTGIQGGSAVGAKLTTVGNVVLVPGDTIIFNRIASVYTSGAGFVFFEFVEVGDSIA